MTNVESICILEYLKIQSNKSSIGNYKYAVKKTKKDSSYKHNQTTSWSYNTQCELQNLSKKLSK